MSGPADGSRRTAREETARALAAPARRALLEFVVGADDPATVAALVDATGLHHTTVRSHLDVLEWAGLVTITTEDRHARGRPRTLVDATPSGIAAIDDIDPYEHLAVLLATVTRTGDAPSAVGRDAGRREAEEHGGTIGVEDLARAFRRRGFAPQVDRTDADTTITFGACPFANAAELDPATVCALHQGWSEGFVEGARALTVDGLHAAPPRTAGCRLVLHEGPIDG